MNPYPTPEEVYAQPYPPAFPWPLPTYLVEGLRTAQTWLAYIADRLDQADPE